MYTHVNILVHTGNVEIVLKSTLYKWTRYTDILLYALYNLFFSSSWWDINVSRYIFPTEVVFFFTVWSASEILFYLHQLREQIHGYWRAFVEEHRHTSQEALEDRERQLNKQIKKDANATCFISYDHVTMACAEGLNKYYFHNSLA